MYKHNNSTDFDKLISKSLSCVNTPDTELIKKINQRMDNIDRISIHNKTALDGDNSVNISSDFIHYNKKHSLFCATINIALFVIIFASLSFIRCAICNKSLFAYDNIKYECNTSIFSPSNTSEPCNTNSEFEDNTVLPWSDNLDSMLDKLCKDPINSFSYQDHINKNINIYNEFVNHQEETLVFMFNTYFNISKDYRNNNSNIDKYKYIPKNQDEELELSIMASICNSILKDELNIPNSTINSEWFSQTLTLLLDGYYYNYGYEITSQLFPKGINIVDLYISTELDV